MKIFTTFKIIFLIIFSLISLSFNTNAEIKSNTVLPPDEKINRFTAVLANTALVRIKPGQIHLKKAFEFFHHNNIEVDYPLLKPEQSITNNPALLSTYNSFMHQRLSQLIKTEEPLLRSFVIEYKSDFLPEEFCIWLKNKCTSIEIAEPYVLPQILKIPNDPIASDQLTLQQINAFQAWDYFDGDTNITIGISDNGALQQHEDLIHSIAPNWNEIPDDNIDNDSNGYIDDFIGYNFNWKDDNDNPGNTYHFVEHGTNVAGVCGATYNNKLGMTGTAAKCRIFPIKAMSNNESQYLKYTYETIIYAGIRQFSVLNCSWGSTGREFSDFEQSIINYAVTRDVAIIAAGGNFTSRSPSPVHPYYPAAYFGILGVGEVDVNNYVTNTTHLGAHVDIMAPGIGNYYTTNSNKYNTGAFSGTSAAAPIVAGFVGLVRAYYPQLNCLQALEFARQCTDDITAYNPQYRDIVPGRLNMLKAFKMNPSLIPGIRPLNYFYYYTDGNIAERLTVADTFILKINAHNYLGAAKNLKFVISSAYDFMNTITILDSSILIENINSDSDFKIDSFSFLVNQYNSDLMFLRIDIYGENDYHDFFLIPFTTGDEMTVFENNAIKFSVSDRGNIGFGGTKNNPQGIGYVLKGFDNQLYKAGLMAIENSNKLVNSLFGTGPDNNDFKPVKTFTYPQRNVGIIDDSRAASNDKIGLEIKQVHLVPSGNYTVSKLIVEVKNISGKILNDVAIGYFFDWDLNDSQDNNLVFLNNDAIPEKMRGPAAAAEIAAYPDKQFPVFGAAIHSNESAATAQAAGLNWKTTAVFSKEDQIKALTSGTSWQTNGPDDISYVIGMMYPGEFLPDSIKKCQICFGAAENLFSLTQRLSTCLELDSFTTYNENPYIIDNTDLVISPNPASTFLKIKLTVNTSANTEIIIFDMLGSKLYSFQFIANTGVNNYIIKPNLNDGIYFLTLKYNHKIITKPFLVVQ